MQLISTVDILLHLGARSSPGDDRLSEVLFTALVDVRMRVFPARLEDVVRLIGPAPGRAMHQPAEKMSNQR